MTKNIQPNQGRQTNFSSSDLPGFIESGWLLALDDSRIAIGWGGFSYRAQPPMEEGTGAVYAPDFYLEHQKPWLVSRSFAIVDRSELAAHFAEPADENKRFQWVEPSRSDFGKTFSRIQEGFANRRLKKAVPVVFETAKGSVDRTQLIRAAIAAPKGLIGYGFWDAHQGLIGTTPEILFDTVALKAGYSLRTMALAGTRAKGEDPDEDANLLFEDPKEREEHQYVVDDIVKVLGPFGEVRTGATDVAFLPTLLHLKTPIELRSPSEIDFTQITKALHPTPALGVAPRRLGFAEMRRWDDPEARRSFGAPFGLLARLSDGQTIARAVVSIRCVQWSKDEIKIGSGCGVVEASSADREWSELKLKRDSVKKVFQI